MIIVPYPKPVCVGCTPEILSYFSLKIVSMQLSKFWIGTELLWIKRIKLKVNLWWTTAKRTDIL